MKTIITPLFLLILFIGVVHSASAENFGFADSEEEIITALTTPGKSMTRSLGLKPSTRAITIMKHQGGQAVKEIIMVANEPTGGLVNLRINFDINSSDLLTESYTILSRLGHALNDKRLTNHKMIICGHTDSDGSSAFNLKLSLKRAEAVRSHLTSVFNISSERLETRGYGENLPLTDNSTEQNRQINRRVEVRVAADYSTSEIPAKTPEDKADSTSGSDLLNW